MYFRFSEMTTCKSAPFAAVLLFLDYTIVLCLALERVYM